MNLLEKITEDLKQAMKDKNSLKLNVIRDIKSGIQLSKIELKHDLSDDEIIDVISKKIKMRRDSVNEFAKANRNDLKEQYEEEIKILEDYMPEQLTSDEVEKIINISFEQIKPTSMKDMGKIMKDITPKIKGKYDMGELSKLIKDKLSSI